MTAVIRTFLHENSVCTGQTTSILSLCLYFDVSNTPVKFRDCILHVCDFITVTKSVHRQSDTHVVVPATTGLFRTTFCLLYMCTHTQTIVCLLKKNNHDVAGAGNNHKDRMNNVKNVKMNVSKCF